MPRFRHTLPLLAIDDTDTRDGGCTTHVALAVAAAIERAGGPLTGWGLVDAARLVRLCPAIPWKTRGNGALVLPIGRREDGGMRVGHHGTTGLYVPGRTLPDGAADRSVAARAPADSVPLADDVVDALRTIVDAHLPAAAADGEDPQPGAVLLPHAPDAALYAAAVTGPVTPVSAWVAAPAGSVRLTAGPRRGEVGALAAAAWPAARYTWEWIGYRDALDRQRERRLSASTLDRLATMPGGFDNVDIQSGRVRCVPRTPCPVLFGLRGLDPHALTAAAGDVPEATHGGWLLRTNHATGDHARHAGSRLGAFRVVRVRATVVGRPDRRRGGHLFVPAACQEGPCHLVAFEPTKSLRDRLADARPGDLLDVLARTGDDARTLRVEAFRCLAAAPPGPTPANPRCGGCGRAMKSAGRDAGYRCRACGTRAARGPVAAALDVAAPILCQVPDHVRGHLLPPAQGLAGARPFRAESPGAAILPVLSAPLPSPLVRTVLPLPS